MNILTIIICCYNAGDFLKECLNSVIAQSVSGSSYNVLFIDDASTDNSLKNAKEYASVITNFTVLNNAQNEGLVNCCNKLLSVVGTPYFIRLDVDDCLSQDAIEKIFKQLNSSDKKNFIVFDRWDVIEKKVMKTRVADDIYTWIAAGTVFETEAVRSIGGYSDEYWEEYDLYIKLLENGFRYGISHNSIYYYRRGHGSMTQDCERKIKGFKSLLKKWGNEVLNKYGKFEKIIGYYKIEV